MGCSSSSNSKIPINVVKPESTRASTIKSDSRNLEEEKSPTSSQSTKGSKNKISFTNRKIAETKEEFDLIIKSADDKLVVIDFYAQWCGPCRRIGPKYEAMSKDPEYENVIFLKVDVDDNSDTAEACGISCMPTFQFYQNGQKIDELSGSDDSQLLAKIKELMVR
ncbi:Thioredoxin [Trichoplax sp. H2]|nr:Thioredoxin [Trichoplax sp. H2]|eukprot:RDD39390.1 Thioredoxin [Trichoplax sp. H2]